MVIQQHHKRIIENIISLGLINGINLLIPLITLPYLIRTVGIDNYGAYAIVYSMLQYGILFSSYGFSFSSTQAIAQNREDKYKVSTIVSATIIARILIMVLITLIIGLICVYIYPEEYILMYIWGIGMIVGDILNPTWLYQGMEKMKAMTIINLVSKLTFTFLIFIFIKNDTDYPYITLLNSVGFIIAGIVSLIWGYKKFDLKIIKPGLPHIKEQFKSGWYIFLSTLSMNLYRNSNVFILGFFVSPGVVGIYSGAEKIIKAFQAVVSPIANALFPYVSKSFKSQNKISQYNSIKQMSKYLSTILLIFSLIAYFSAPLANKILLDNASMDAIKLIRIMTPVIFFGGLNYILGIVGLVNAEEKKSFFHFVMCSGILSILFLLISVKWIGAVSASISMTISEVVLFMMCVWKWRKIRSNKSNKN